MVADLEGIQSNPLCRIPGKCGPPPATLPGLPALGVALQRERELCRERDHGARVDVLEEPPTQLRGIRVVDVAHGICHLDGDFLSFPASQRTIEIHYTADVIDGP